MIILVATLLALALTDLFRPLGPPSIYRDTAGSILGAAAAAVLLLLSGYDGDTPLTVAGIILGLVVWVGASRQGDRRRARIAIGTFLVVVAAAFACGGGGVDSTSQLGDWYETLDWNFTSKVPAEQVIAGGVVALFLLATSNRLVRLVLVLADSPAEKNEQEIKGGRILGQLERLIIAVLVVAGEFGGAALVIAAKGLIRLPELGDAENDDLAEYLLIGTFSSLLIAAAGGYLILAVG